MSDFEQFNAWVKENMRANTVINNPEWWAKKLWNIAIASMQGEAVAWRIEVSREGWKYGNYFYHDKKFESDRHVRILREDKSLTATQSPLFTYPPSASAEIACLQKELEEALKDAERYRMVRSLDVTPYGKWNKAQKTLHRALNSADTNEMVDAAVDAAIRQIGGAE